MSLLAIGECMVELGGRQRDADGERWRLAHAGDTFNAAYVARALGATPVDYHTAHGDDPFSEAMRETMRACGVGEAASPVLAGRRPGLYAITLDGAERSFTYWRSDSAARHLADDPDALRRSLAGRDWAFVSGITLAIAHERRALIDALIEAAKLGTRIAFDPNHRPRLWDAAEARRAHAALLSHVDLVLTGTDDERALGGAGEPAAIVERYARPGRTVVVKDGANGAWLDGPHGAVRVPARPANAVDTTGAGDAFDGGMLAGLMRGMDAEGAARLAVRAAAVTVAHHGARAPASALRAALDDPPDPPHGEA